MTDFIPLTFALALQLLGFALLHVTWRDHRRMKAESRDIPRLS